MEIFKNKFLVKLLASICLFLTLFNFAGTTKVYADPGDDGEDLWGGILITPIINLFAGIGDFIMEILHDSIQSQRQAIIKLNGSSTAANAWAFWGSIVVGVLVAVAVIALTVVTAGAITAALAAVGVAATFTVSLRINSNRSCCWDLSWNSST